MSITPKDESSNTPADEAITLALPSLEYLLTCSKDSLADVELSNLNLAANCLKRARSEWNEAVAHREAAGVARWLMQNRDALLQQATRTLEVKLDDELPHLATMTGSKRDRQGRTTAGVSLFRQEIKVAGRSSYAPAWRCRCPMIFPPWVSVSTKEDYKRISVGN